MLKLVVQIVFLILPILGLAQNSSSQDSIRNTARLFFSKVDKIELVKLKPYCDSSLRIDHEEHDFKMRVYCFEESILQPENAHYPIDTAHIGKRYQLQSDEVDVLFNLLYIGERSNRMAACYEPRHGIIFYDSDGDMTGFLEICFACRRIYRLWDTPSMGPLEGKPFRDLKELFRGKGLVDDE
jgi:hypothetical protein